jgi:hypothetical protein
MPRAVRFQLTEQPPTPRTKPRHSDHRIIPRGILRTPQAPRSQNRSNSNDGMHTLTRFLSPSLIICGRSTTSNGSSPKPFYGYKDGLAPYVVFHGLRLREHSVGRVSQTPGSCGFRSIPTLYKRVKRFQECTTYTFRGSLSPTNVPSCDATPS